MKKSVVTRMSLRSDKDVETYLLKSGSGDNEKMSCYRQFNRGFNFYEENYIHDILFFSDRLFKRYVSTSLSERKLILVTTDFFITFRKNCASSVFFLKLESLQVLPWNLRQLISYFFALII
jgi:hypothetical protein